MCNEKSRSRGGSRDFEKGRGLCRPPWLADEKNFGFQMSKKTKTTLEKFLAKYLFQYFQIFSISIYNESLPIKSDQFFKICKRFYKKREKVLIK